MSETTTAEATTAKATKKTTSAAKAIEKKASALYKKDLAKDVKQALDEAIEEAFEIGRFDEMTATQAANIINGLAAQAMALETFAPVVEQIRKHQHFDIKNWRYHADVLYKGAATVAVGAGAFILASFLTRRGEAVEGVSGSATGGNPFSDTTPAFEATPRPSRVHAN